MGLARSLGGYVLCLGHGALGVLGPSAVQAQAFLSTEVPAEFPPASFRAAQYVDSRGCVYVRAGASGVVNWVPRINRQRQHICNAQPSPALRPPRQHRHQWRWLQPRPQPPLRCGLRAWRRPA
jgi:hypothetical protein